jgi:hypothetical protein
MTRLPSYAAALGLLLATPTGTNAQEARDTLGKQLGPITTAIVRENQAAEKALNLLARVEVRPDEIVEFYEPFPGRILISGAGAPATPGMTRSVSSNPSQVWRQIAPGVDIPPALRDAIQRAEQRQAVQRPKLTKARNRWSGGSSRGDFTKSAGWCDTGYYEGGWDTCEDFYSYRVCLLNVRDWAWAEHHEAFNTWTQVCPATGPVVFKVRSTEWDGVVLTVNQNTVRYVSYADPPCSSPFDDCPYVRADVQHATGVRFHFQFLVEEE